MNNLAQQTELLLLDFDGTFYRFPEAFIDHCDEAVVRTALRLGAPLSPEDALTLARRSYVEHGSGLALFQRLYGLRIEDCHDVYHEEITHDLLETCQVTAKELRGCDVPLAVLSHSNRTWLLNLLRKFGLDDLFPEDRVLGLEDVGFVFKHDGTESYRRALNKLGATASKTVMVEDTLHNLAPAKKLGLTTVYVTQDRPFDKAKHAHVDHVFRDLPAFLDVFKRKG